MINPIFNVVPLYSVGDRQFIGSMRGNKSVEKQTKTCAKELDKLQKEIKDEKTKR